MSMLKLASRVLAASAFLSALSSCSTKPLALPIPNVCFERCRVQTCKLSQYYVGKDDEDRQAEELNCTEVNGTQARDCAKLKDACAEALKGR